MYTKPDRDTLPDNVIGKRFSEYPTGIYEGHKGYSKEEAEKKKEEIEKELFSLDNTFKINVVIEDAPAGGFKVVDKSSYVRYPYC